MIYAIVAAFKRLMSVSTDKRAPVSSLMLCLIAASAGRAAAAEQSCPVPPSLLEPSDPLALAGPLSLSGPLPLLAQNDGESSAPEQAAAADAQQSSVELPSGVEISAGHLEGGTRSGFVLSNGVQITRGDQSLAGQRAIYDSQSQHGQVEGRVTYEDANVMVFGEDADFDTENRRVSFGEAGFEIPARPARGSAQQVTIGGDKTMSLSSVHFTTCPVDSPTWELQASSLLLDVDRGFGTARGVKLEFKGVPIFYAPFFTFPISDERKSGFLTPSFGQRDRTGLDISVPYYLNLKPNIDLTIEPHYLSKRGLKLDNELRYLLPRTVGEFSMSYLPNDDVTSLTRWYVDLQHRTAFAEGWDVQAGIEQVSDDAYFEDLGSSLSVTSQLYLDRYIDVTYSAPYWSVRSRLQNYQTIDATIAPEDRPYERLPQVLFQGRWYRGLLGLDSSSELVNFERDVGETGWRLDSTEELSLRFARAGLYLTPAVALRQTNYWLGNTPVGSDDSLSRTVPVTSLDAGLRLERVGRGSRGWLQTLEPRVLYVRVPFVDQSNLPVFDTIVPDFNLVQLFRKYQYVGPDRISDTDQVSVGFTGRLIDEETGEQKLAATLGQTRYLTSQNVTLPGAEPLTANASDYVAEVSVNVLRTWSLDLGLQWNSDTNRAARTETRFEYRPAPDRLFGFGYRYRRGVLQQGDVSLVWPATDRWRVIGRYSYSFFENEPLERFLGWEYDSCCWRFRVVGRSYVGHRTGETDNGISVQFELKGFSQRATAPEELLDRGILGYRGLSEEEPR
ncbi:MAG TPA: LPS assembly protein LptD [Gammaproteobacteria bacterium]|nr:LPS assembly protein LptD [Gammaproteobacteria bacterium]